MDINLSKRILTSFFLLFLLSISIFFNKYLWLIMLVIISIISFDEFNNLFKNIFKKKNNSLNLAVFFSMLYLFFFIFASYNIYQYPPFELIFIILVCIFSDTGGFFIGKLVGGKRLTKISPNKTISGSIGSFIFSLIPVII